MKCHPSHCWRSGSTNSHCTSSVFASLKCVECRVWAISGSDPSPHSEKSGFSHQLVIEISFWSESNFFWVTKLLELRFSVRVSWFWGLGFWEVLGFLELEGYGFKFYVDGFEEDRKKVPAPQKKRKKRKETTKNWCQNRPFFRVERGGGSQSFPPIGVGVITRKNSDRTGNEQDHVEAVKDSTDKCNCCIGGSGRVVPKGNRTGEAEVRVKWESVVVERIAWEQEK